MFLMSNFPVLKKKLSSFVRCEEGKISKDSIVYVGSIAAAFAVGAALSSKEAAAHNHVCTHTNNLEIRFANSQLTAIHSHSVAHMPKADAKTSCPT